MVLNAFYAGVLNNRSLTGGQLTWWTKLRGALAGDLQETYQGRHPLLTT